MNPKEMAKALGSLGGKARAKRLSAERKKEIATLGGQSKKNSLQAARRIANNLSYARAFRDLQGGYPRVTRAKTTNERLPGLYLHEKD